MLTVKQQPPPPPPPPPPYGYKSVYDLPTPPSTSRPSPPLTQQEWLRSFPSTNSRSYSPDHHHHHPPMSAPHRGLPPPAGMGMTQQQQPPPLSSASPAHHSQHHSQPQPPPSQTHPYMQHQQQSQHQQQQQQPPQQPPPSQSQQSQQQPGWSQLPAPPQSHQGAEESMKTWLQARAEEEKTRQEEEKTKQEELRLEQRRVEMDMLKASFSGGIPPPMVPLVFAGLGTGGVLPPAALDFAQQFLQNPQAHYTQLMTPAAGQRSPKQQQQQQQREAPGTLSSSAAGPASGASAGSGPYAPFSGSPSRPRGQTISGPVGRAHHGSTAGLGAIPAYHSTSSVLAHGQGHLQGQDSGPSIYFHHWQPPTSQANSGANRSGSPSIDTPKKRKATGPMQGPQQTTTERLQSPPSLVQNSLSNSSQSRKGHKRQRSDISWYRPGGHGFSEDAEPRAKRPSPPSRHYSREPHEPRKHSVSMMLSEDASASTDSRRTRPTDHRQHEKVHRSGSSPPPE